MEVPTAQRIDRMKSNFLSRFTPSLMTPETLEAIFVQRHDLANNLVELIRESVLTESKHHHLLTGMRGIGKTHLVALIYHRVSRMDDLRAEMRIAWLQEEEWGVTSFLDLLLRIFRALQKEYPEEYNATLDNKVEALYELSPDAAENTAAELLREFVGNRTLLLLVENLDDLFEGLGDIGQKQLRAYLQNYPFFAILATAQNLFNGVKRKTSPFYGFFCQHDLEKLTADEAICLLTHIAKLEGKQELESFIQTPTGRDRISAVHHLAGGNHRLYVIFSEFLTRNSLDELVEPFMRTLDELTPYYQARMAWLSQQQRKIIEFLCDRRQAVTVKEIAQRCFITHQTASSQLKDLRDKGYVTSVAIGRESFYELREPLMRFCLEVKKQRGEPIRLFVDFLRIWYTRTELQERLPMLNDDAALEREYVLHALMAQEEGEDPRVAAYLKDFDNYFQQKDNVHALQIAEKLVSIRGHAQDWFLQAGVLSKLERYEQALASLDKAIELDPNHRLVWYVQAIVLDALGRYEEALTSYNKGIELDPNYGGAWYLRGATLGKMERYEEALLSYDKVIELEVANKSAWYLRGLTLLKLERYDECLASLDKVIELNPNDVIAWYLRGVALANLECYEEALLSFDKLIELDPSDVIAWYNRGAMLVNLERYDEALVSWDKAIELDSTHVDTWLKRGWLLGELGHYDEALVSWDKAIELDSTDADTWLERGWLLGELGHYDEALTSCDKAIQLGEQSSYVLFNRAECLLALKRWDEGYAALDDALERFAHADEPDTGDTTAIIRNLFNSTYDAAIWRSRITTLIELYDKHQVISALGEGLVKSIPALMPEMVSDKAARTWLEVWRQIVGDRTEFQIPLRFLNAAVRYRETKGDPRVLLELPIEERNLLKPLLGIEESSKK